MKVFAVFMSFLILGLTVMPCMDAVAFSIEDHKTELSSQGNCGDHEDRDDCSPFCSCTCCAGSTVINGTVGIASVHIFPAKTYHTYLPTDPTAISRPVWQPPRLS